VLSWKKDKDQFMRGRHVCLEKITLS